MYQLICDRILVFLEFESTEEVTLLLHAAPDQFSQLLTHQHRNSFLKGQSLVFVHAHVCHFFLNDFAGTVQPGV